MNVKLIDVIRETEEDVEFGTCELCFSVGNLDTETLIFQDGKGKQLEYELGSWSWGDYIQNYYIDNIIDFANFINEKKIMSLDEIQINFDNLYDEYTERIGQL